MSWGTKIFMLYGGFVALIAFLVVSSMRQNVDLVAEDYYQQELQYQNKIDQSTAAIKNGYSPAFVVNDDQVSVVFPDTVRSIGINGEVVFYRPDNKALDFTEQIALDNAGKMSIPRSMFSAGMYQAKVMWKSAGQDYYYESTVHIR
jgi:nitrogen fixation protein FixH